jgi:DnaJ-class molecular chaperone
MKIHHALVACAVCITLQPLGSISPAISQANPPVTNSPVGNYQETYTNYDNTISNDSRYIQSYITFLTLVFLLLPGYLKYRNSTTKYTGEKQYGRSQSMAKKQGDDIEIDIAIGFFEAIFGVEKEITISRLEIDLNKKLRKVTKSIRIRIPAGGDRGSRVRFRGYGNASDSGGKPGDLYAHLLIPSQNGELTRCGINIESTIKLTEEKAQAGCTFIIRTIEGDREIVVSPRTRNGDSLVLKGCGVSQFENPSKKGDHTIHFCVQNIDKIRGDNLYCDLEIEFREAIFGGEKKIKFSHMEVENGKNLVRVTKSIEVMIPAGVDSGTKLRVVGQGDASRSGGETGDLYINLLVPSQDTEFNRCGVNIESEIKLTEEQAQVGCDFFVKMLEGEKKIAVSPGTKNGDFLTLKGCGVSQLGNITEKGDHIIHFVLGS